MTTQKDQGIFINTTLSYIRRNSLDTILNHLWYIIRIAAFIQVTANFYSLYLYLYSSYNLQIIRFVTLFFQILFISKKDASAHKTNIICQIINCILSLYFLEIKNLIIGIIILALMFYQSFFLKHVKAKINNYINSIKSSNEVKEKINQEKWSLGWKAFKEGVSKFISSYANGNSIAASSVDALNNAISVSIGILLDTIKNVLDTRPFRGRISFYYSCIFVLLLGKIFASNNVLLVFGYIFFHSIKIINENMNPPEIILLKQIESSQRQINAGQAVISTIGFVIDSFLYMKNLEKIEK